MSGQQETLRLPDAAVTFFEEAKVPLRLGVNTASGWPVVLSLWFLERGGSLWCATQGAAKVVEYLLRDPRCAFEVAPDQPPYRGVRGKAVAELHRDRGEEVLRDLLGRYLGGTDSPLAAQLLAKARTEVAIEVRPISLSIWDFTERMRESVRGNESGRMTT